MPLPPHLWEDCRSRVCRQQLKENQEQQPQQQACLHGAQPTDKVQVSEQLQIPQERRQDQSPEQTLATAATRGNPCDEDEGPDFDLLCVQALESFEMMMASNAVI
ncbi:hypothetical protein Vretimale_5715 [Volvox reticuliferus]|nr:hypothetical protein Vretimale_5715 [Volvox reticuliferus]